jgi:hypothetical protein
MVVTKKKFEDIFVEWCSTKSYDNNITDIHMHELWEKLIPLFEDGVVIVHSIKT